MAPLLAHRLVWDHERSFESVYRKHVRDVYGFSLSILGNAQDAEDVTQTTFLNAYRALSRGEKIQNVRAWLLAIAHNVCRQRFRTAARRPQEVEFDPEVAEAFYDEDAPTATEIRSAMSQLAFNQRTILVLREIEGLTYEEIGEAMGISLSAVETLLFRARQALREQLEAAEQDLGCEAVERLISLQLDGKLSRPDRRLLRAHLRSCGECAKFARSQRARKKVMPSLIAVPLPAGLSGAFDLGGAGVITAKLTALAVGAALVGTGALVSTGVVPLPSHGDKGREAKAVERIQKTFTSSSFALSRDSRATVLSADIRAAQAPGGVVAVGAGQTGETGETKRDPEPDPSPQGAPDDPLVPISELALEPISEVALEPISKVALEPVSEVAGALDDTIQEAVDTLPGIEGSPKIELPPSPVPSLDDDGPLLP
ncbi:MAG: sigma-70 family RNA polymerase sigma factor [Actinomycetota bacterium]|nr:sigma-70 family RNA polymerase sigma factor [Actinomycetota bacterium]